MDAATYCDGSSAKDLRPCQRLSSSWPHKRTTPSSTPPRNSAAAQIHIPPAGPPPILVEQTCTSSALSPPTIVDQATLLLPNIATKHHCLPSTNVIPPSASLNRIVPTPSSVEQAFSMLPPIHVKIPYAGTVKDATHPPLNYTSIIHHTETPPSTIVRTTAPACHHSLLPPFSVEQAFPMLPPKNVDTITATTSAPTVEYMSTPPPLNYISTTPIVSSSSITASNSRRQHFPAQKENAPHPHHPPPSNLCQITNMCWLAITESIINNPSLFQPSATIDTELSQFLINVCNA